MVLFVGNGSQFTSLDNVSDVIERYSQLTGVEVACSNGLPQCLKMASNMFVGWMTSDENR